MISVMELKINAIMEIQHTIVEYDDVFELGDVVLLPRESCTFTTCSRIVFLVLHLFSNSFTFF